MNAEQYLGLFGLDCGSLAAILLGFLVIQVIAVHFGTRLSGLRGGFFQAVFVLPTTALFCLPGGWLLVRLQASGALGETAEALFGALVVLVAETAAIRWLYHADVPRSLLAYLVASILGFVVSSLLMISFF